jgi:hypothetical protein
MEARMISVRTWDLSISWQPVFTHWCECGRVNLNVYLCDF